MQPALSQVRETRSNRRRRLAGFMPGRLYTASRQEVYCRPMDVSASGIGVFSEDDLKEVGKDFVLVIANREIPLELVWSLASPGPRVGYRHGFKVRDPDVDLESLCIMLGCI